jgi:hypothetical protein
MEASILLKMNDLTLHRLLRVMGVGEVASDVKTKTAVVEFGWLERRTYARQ